MLLDFILSECPDGNLNLPCLAKLEAETRSRKHELMGTF